MLQIKCWIIYELFTTKKGRMNVIHPFFYLRYDNDNCDARNEPEKLFFE